MIEETLWRTNEQLSHLPLQFSIIMPETDYNKGIGMIFFFFNFHLQTRDDLHRSESKLVKRYQTLLTAIGGYFPVILPESLLLLILEVQSEKYHPITNSVIVSYYKCTTEHDWWSFSLFSMRKMTTHCSYHDFIQESHLLRPKSPHIILTQGQAIFKYTIETVIKVKPRVYLHKL